MNSIKIREVILEDSYNLIRLIIPDFAERTDKSLSEGKYFRKWLENFKIMLNSELVKSYVAENPDKEILAVLTVYLLPRLELAEFYAVIEDVYVKESERSKGIGTLLFNEVMLLLKDQNVRYVTLNVAKDNLKGQEFYKRLGFSNRAVEMSKELGVN